MYCQTVCLKSCTQLQLHRPWGQQLTVPKLSTCFQHRRRRFPNLGGWMEVGAAGGELLPWDSVSLKNQDLGLKSVFPNVPGEEHHLELLLKSLIGRLRSNLYKTLLETAGGGICEFDNNPELLLSKFHPRYSLD